MLAAILICDKKSDQSFEKAEMHMPDMHASPSSLICLERPPIQHWQASEEQHAETKEKKNEFEIIERSVSCETLFV